MDALSHTHTYDKDRPPRCAASEIVQLPVDEINGLILDIILPL